MMKAIGFTDEDLARPQIGVAHCWIGTMPCNWNHRELAQKVDVVVENFPAGTLAEGMAKDFSWESSAKKYINLYRSLLK